MFCFTRAGRDWNEDKGFVCKDFGFVLDGATTVVNQKFSNCESDAQWSSNWWNDYLKEALTDKNKSIAQILKVGVKKSTKEFRKFAKGHIEDFPSCTASIVRRLGDKIEFYVLANSPIVVRAKTGQVFTIIDPLNNIMTDIIGVIYKDLALKENITIPEAKKKYPEHILDGRKIKNTFGGYYVLANSAEAVNHGIYTTIDANLIDKVLIMSDGFSQVFDLMKFISPEEMTDKINSVEDAERVYNKLYEIQEMDKEEDKYFRFKVRDDATLVCMKF
ncbi:MAG: hypothetical protein E7375_02210 [Clostridiales bacterium]|nr:hypothetical protein [Clostridiales bacterium]